MAQPSVSRRSFLKTTALATSSAIAAPYVRTSYAAGTLALGLWDHWVPGANETMKKIILDWGAKNHVEVHIDFIASIDGRLLITAAAEEAAGVGHDVLSYYGNWEVAIHRKRLEPVDDLVQALVKKYGPLNPMVEYLAKLEGHSGDSHEQLVSSLLSTGSL
jgi:ABC-type glycerol-3-phosphate transport system substrate-binding protein